MHDRRRPNAFATDQWGSFIRSWNVTIEQNYFQVLETTDMTHKLVISLFYFFVGFIQIG